MLSGLGVAENWLENTLKARKMRYFGNIKRHNGLKKLIAKDIMPGESEKGRLVADGLRTYENSEYVIAKC